MATESVAKWTTVRVSQDLKPMIGELAEETGMSQGDVIGVALTRMRDEMLLEASNEAYARMLADPEMAKAWKEEIGVWDSLPDDGLEEL